MCPVRLHYLTLSNLRGESGVVEENADLFIRHTRHSEADPTTKNRATVKRILPLEGDLHRNWISDEKPRPLVN
jgi:hypothetical protein